MSLRPEWGPPFLVSMFLDFPTFLPTLNPGATHRPIHQIPTAQHARATRAAEREPSPTRPAALRTVSLACSVISSPSRGRAVAGAVSIQGRGGSSEPLLQGGGVGDRIEI